jgi:hypothetical protein
MSKDTAIDNVITLRGDGIIHSCATCAFNEMQPVAMPDGKPIIGKSQMVCKRFPPQVVSMQVPTPAGISVSLLPMFPPVNDGMWCFEHEPENGAQDVS